MTMPIDLLSLSHCILTSHTDGSRHQCRWKFPKYPLASTIFVDANREVPEEEYKMPKEKRDEILDRVMKVLVETEGNKMMLSREVEEIMTSFSNVKVVAREQNAEEEEDRTPKESLLKAKESLAKPK